MERRGWKHSEGHRRDRSEDVQEQRGVGKISHGPVRAGDEELADAEASRGDAKRAGAGGVRSGDVEWRVAEHDCQCGGWVAAGEAGDLVDSGDNKLCAHRRVVTEPAGGEPPPEIEVTELGLGARTDVSRSEADRHGGRIERIQQRTDAGEDLAAQAGEFAWKVGEVGGKGHGQRVIIAAIWCVPGDRFAEDGAVGATIEGDPRGRLFTAEEFGESEVHRVPAGAVCADQSEVDIEQDDWGHGGILRRPAATQHRRDSGRAAATRALYSWDMSSTELTLGQALAEYLQSLKAEQRRTSEVYVRKYVDYAGETMLVAALTGSRVELYAESQIRHTDPAAPERVAALKAWFQFLKKKEYTTANYGIHIRARKAPARAAGQSIARTDQTPLEMTEEGIAGLQDELKSLTSQRGEHVQAIEYARQDGDLRENAPYHAAREALAFTDQRHRQISEALRRAVVVDGASRDDRSQVGSVVSVTNLEDERRSEYRLVNAREANAAERKISVDSPVGKQLLGRRAGEEVRVTTPRGDVRFRVELVANG